MSSHSLDPLLPEGFANIVRLFPLPNLVLFPGVVQALHLFEPRYRALAEDALAADGMITMAYIKSDDSTIEDFGKPDLASTVCVGKILSHTRLEDGRYNMFLVGTKRATIVTELEQDTPYRMAEVKILNESNAFGDKSGLRDRITAKFRELAALRTSWNHEALDQFLSDELPFGQLVDMICYSCGADPADQLRVLETVDLTNRGEIVLELLKSQINSSQLNSVSKPDFPPGFSVN